MLSLDNRSLVLSSASDEWPESLLMQRDLLPLRGMSTAALVRQGRELNCESKGSSILSLNPQNSSVLLIECFLYLWQAN